VGLEGQMALRQLPEDLIHGVPEHSGRNPSCHHAPNNAIIVFSGFEAAANQVEEMEISTLRAGVVGVPRETFPGETRVALAPTLVPVLAKVGSRVVIETGAGEAAGFADEAYAEQGASVGSRDEVFAADVVLQVRTLGANPLEGREDLGLLRADQVVIGFCDPLSAPAAVRDLAERRVTAFAMELIPRIARAQSMDALSSQATVAGYKAVLMAADRLPKMFPMLTTAAGTLAPARVFVVGAGVAGLQAIATARRLGAVVEAYDVRAAAQEEVKSLGARFVDLPLKEVNAEGAGGYAKDLGEETNRRQQQLLARVVSGCDVIIATASIPGRRAPVLISREAVASMPPGSVIVDLAAERGGNCELTRPDEIVTANRVTILGPTNLPASVPRHASVMYAKNICAFFLHLVKDGKLQIDPDDPITCETLVTHAGSVVHPRVSKVLEATIA